MLFFRWFGCRSRLTEWFDRYPQMAMNYIRFLSGRIRFLNRRLDAFSKNTVPARLMSFLTSEANGRSVSVKSYTKLSESICISRATLYRALDTLESDGKIRRDRKNIVLLEDYES